MSIRLRSYEVSAATVPARTVGLHRLACAEGPHATVANEGFIERNSKPLSAFKNAVRYVRHERLHVYELKHGRTSRGVATIVEGASITHPDLQVAGHDLDYWLRHDAGDDEHRAAAFAVIARSIQLLRNKGASYTYPTGSASLTGSYFATSWADQPELNRGFADVLGEPAARLRVPETDDDIYGIAKDGAELDVYVGRHVIDNES